MLLRSPVSSLLVMRNIGKMSNYYFKSCRVVFHGTPKYINYDIDFGFNSSRVNSYRE